ncbi:matrilin-3-like [Haliotis cracherodii]|uniref:matrilin-3-like n=1 Tax=Haliotis cracherodii TaxID=6455 RepID=UPI0039EA4947
MARMRLIPPAIVSLPDSTGQRLKQQLVEQTIQNITKKSQKTPLMISLPYFGTVCSSARKDVIFVMEDSSNISAMTFNSMKTFIFDVVSMFTIANNNVNVGIVKFGSTAVVEFIIQDYQKDKPGLLSAVNDMVQRGESMVLPATAFALTRSDVLQPNLGDRPNADNIVIFITGSVSDNTPTTLTEADLLRAEVAEMFGVGVGLSDLTELNYIANDPDLEFVFSVAGSGDLSTIINSVSATVCGACNPACSSTGKCDRENNVCECYPGCQNGGTCDTSTSTCNCPTDTVGDSCEDTNECTAMTDDCDENAQCDNTIGSFNCTCNSGFEGDGTSCTGECFP